MRHIIAAVAIAGLAVAVVPANAGPTVSVPVGTDVLLKFLTPVDSGTVKEGAEIKFEVASDVLIDRLVIFRMGDPGRGIVTDVSQPGIFGKNARVHIAFIQATAVDGRPVRLSPLDVTPESVREVKDAGAAGASSLAGAILLGPVGLAAGAFIHGGQVSVPAGAVGTTKVAQTFQITVP